MKLIDADALIEVIKKSMAENPHKEEMQRAMHIHEHKYFLTLLAGIPTIQPVATDTNVGDAISRQAAIDALNKQIQQCRKALGSLSLSDVDKHAVEVKMASLRAYREMLENLPSIQPEPKEGRWISGKCDLCGEHAPFWCMASTYHESNFCPHCGARMKGERQK